MSAPKAFVISALTICPAAGGLQQVCLSKALVDNGMAAGDKKSPNVFRVSENIVTFAKF